MKQIIYLVLMACALCTAVGATAGAYDMKTLTIHTLTAEEAQYDPAERRLGLMVVDRQALATVERPWLPNPDLDNGGGGIPFQSAVPLGEYDLVLRESPSKGWQWHLVNEDLHVYLEKQDCPDLNTATCEPDHSRYSCMFHVGNFVSSVVGCIALGTRLHDFGADGGLGVASSALAMRMLKDYLRGEDRAKLRIV